MKIYKLLFIVFLMGLSTYASATLVSGRNSSFYYDIGGARSISLPPNAAVRTTQLSGALELGLGYSCGNFNVSAGLKNALTGVVDQIKNYAVGALTGAISSAPMLILQRVSPGAYDMLQNLMIKAEAMVALSNKSCEDYEAQIKRGENPYSNWTDLAKQEDWKVQMGNSGYSGSSTDVVTAQQEVQKNNGKNGVHWVGGAKKGGISDPPIKATYDVTKAGYNITMNRAPDADQTSVIPLAASVGRADQLFDSSDDVGQWAVDVLGDVHIKTYDNHITETVPGHGLLPKIASETEDVQLKLFDLVNGSKSLTLENLGEVSSKSVLLTRELIEAIQSFDKDEQGLVIDKLSSESAMARVMEKALFVRRFLLTGVKEPNVTYTDAHKFVDNNVEQIDWEINNILFEKRVYTEVSSKTPALILALKNKYENRGSTEKKEAGFENKILEEGAVKP